MTNHDTNPFVLPGMGQGSGDAAGNPLLASMEMMRQAWAGLTGPGGLAQVMPMTPPMNLPDLERRIAELRSVESWLRMNLSMLSSTIQGLEVQRSTIATLRSFVDNMGAQAQDPAGWGGASPLEVVLGLKPAPGQSGGAPAGGARDARSRPDTRSDSSPSSDADWRSGDDAPSDPDTRSGGQGQDPKRGAHAAAGPSSNTDAPSSGARGSGDAATGASSAGSAQAISQAAQSASEAWWGMLQQQFNQLAAATAATMPGGPAGPGAAQGASAGGPTAGPDTGRGSSAPKASAASSSRTGATASKAGAMKKAPASAPPGAPRKTAVKKNKIQSDPEQS